MTNEQIKEFWEWCGGIKRGEWWDFQDGESIPQWELDIDLNNLFKYAVPKLTPKTLMIESYIENGVMLFSIAILSEKKSGGLWCGNDKDLATALLEAIWKVIK